MQYRQKYSLILMCCVLLGGCVESGNYAPVADISMIEPIPKSGKHQVKQGETLYEVAWRYGLDYRSLASGNRVSSSQHLRTGKVLSLRNDNQFISPAKTNDDMPLQVTSWIKPAAGKIVRGFSGANKGINIAGSLGEPIMATAAGRVVYCGDGLKAYGNLIIIKHNNLYLSAYAHNQRIFVHEGEWVRQGQKIALMGNTGTDKTMLHFEIRQAGKPINPMNLLKS